MNQVRRNTRANTENGMVGARKLGTLKAGLQPTKPGVVKTKNVGFVAKKMATRGALKAVNQNPSVVSTALTSAVERLKIKGEAKRRSRKSNELCKVEPMEVVPVVEQEKIEFELPKGVSNVDEEDQRDPQLCSENVRDIYIYLRQLEKQQPVKENYFQGTSLLPKMRIVLVNWLAEVHDQFKLLQETLYLAVAILDRYLSREAHRIKKYKLQLVGVTALFIAGKYEEMYTPEIGDFVFITDNSCTDKDIRNMEMEMLRVLNFDLGRPLSINFLRRFSKVGDVSAEEHNMAKYFLEASFMEYSLAHVEPSRMAAAALLMSSRLSNGQNNFDKAWSPNLIYYSGYEVESLIDVSAKLAKVVLGMKSSKYAAIFKKYKVRSKLSVSEVVDSTYRAALEAIVDERSLQ